MSALSITWYGHATFVIGTPGGRRIVFDPWLTGNPKAPAGAKIDKADVICVSHGHADHSSDVVTVARATGATVVAVFELANYFQGKGLKEIVGMGVGGTVDGGVNVNSPYDSSSNSSSMGGPSRVGGRSASR